MTTDWKKVPLYEVMHVDIDAVSVNDLSEFPIAGVYSFARGLFARETLLSTQTTYKFFHRLHKDMFVISTPKAWEGAIARVTDEFDGYFLSPVFPTFATDATRLDIRFLEWYTRQSIIWQELRNKSHGMGARRESVSIQQFLSLEIPLPPLDEQRRIVARIEALAARVREALSLREKAVEEAEVLFYSFLKQHREQLQTLYPQKKIGEITKVTSGGTPDRSNSLYWENGTFPWVKTGELSDGFITGSEEYINLLGIENSSANLFPVDTVLIALYGQGQTRGRTGILKIQATTNQACAAIFPQPQIYKPLFMQFWLRSLYHELRTQNRAGAQPNWNGGTIKNISIALPPIIEQERIIEELNDIQQKIYELHRLQAETQAELTVLLPSILDRAFRGEL